MASIGIRELKAHASRVVRRVRQRGEAIDVTYRGEIVARLVPVPRPRASRRSAAVWSDLDRLASEIGARWRGRRSAVAAVREGRREL